ncbi:MAG: hypothetical protein OEZ02_09795, partial [Anaerolineae bacterium]|nr:hypothetical protein [Anaerolineae bacterium]
LKFSPESFIPAGTFLFNEDDDTPYARAVFTGKVLKTAKLTNGHTGRPFYWAHVRTLGGEVDVVADPDVLEGELVEGGIVYGDFWLSGKIVASEQ